MRAHFLCTNIFIYFHISYMIILCKVRRMCMNQHDTYRVLQSFELTIPSCCLELFFMAFLCQGYFPYFWFCLQNIALERPNYCRGDENVSPNHFGCSDRSEWLALLQSTYPFQTIPRMVSFCVENFTNVGASISHHL